MHPLDVAQEAVSSREHAAADTRMSVGIGITRVTNAQVLEQLTDRKE